jgi:hypothetical protein
MCFNTGWLLFSLVPASSRLGIRRTHNSRWLVCVFITELPITKLFAWRGQDPTTSPSGGSDPTHQGIWSCVCVYYCSIYYKAVRVGGGGNNGGHVLPETTSRSLCGLVVHHALVNAGARDIE